MGKLGAPKIIVVKLQGGLGNQLFQYAAARGIAPGHQLLFDRSFLERNSKTTAGTTARAFELSIFVNLKVKAILRPLLGILKSESIFLKIIRRVLFRNMLQIQELSYRSLPESDMRQAPIYLDGYFQDERFFRHLRGQLLKELEFPDLDRVCAAWLARIMAQENAVSIHVRRGDYLNPEALQYHGVLGEDYYQKSVARIDSMVFNPHYFIFSEDTAWCADHFGFLENKTLVPRQTDWVDMALMSRCRHHIIANSTFSWWAAWLNDYAEKIVVAPKQWFADGRANVHQASVVPDNWISV